MTARLIDALRADRPAADRAERMSLYASSFRWRGERSRDGGATWQLQADFSLRRTAT